MRRILNTTDLARPISSIFELGDVAECLGDLIFRGELLGRRDLIIARSGSMKINLRGYMAVIFRCYIDQMVHRVKTVIDPDDYPVRFDKSSPEFISTILHEMCHAFSLLFVIGDR